MIGPFKCHVTRVAVAGSAYVGAHGRGGGEMCLAGKPPAERGGKGGGRSRWTQE